ncbi:MAG: sulfatase-like hydrolase/transferase [Bacteroidales bacterium]|jgi:phosphoglycerol transferase MdoB-like AlkP superfamily enzyme|nr:sulfatase-like hydrolase/transferase [Bacteroidales bacterium]
MKQRIQFFLSYFLYWIVFFAVARLVFMAYNHELSFLMSAGEWFSTFRYGLRMDASMSGYISAVAALILTASAFMRGKAAAGAMSAYTATALVIACILVVSDMELYRHWGFRLDSTPLGYLKTPREALGSASLWALAVQLALFAALLYGSWICYRKLLRPRLMNVASAGWMGIPVFLFATALMILPIRGSLGIAPMNVGFVYFHPDNIFANHSAVNVMWNAGKSLLNTNEVSEYHFMDDRKAKDIFAACYPPAAHTEILLKEERPNVIVIILESFSNRMIEALGGLPGVTPNLNQLCREGIVFSNLYSNSDRTDKGILGVLSGYPVHPVAKVINFPEKTRQLPYLNKDLKQAGYHTGFVYGYDAHYSNFASYFGNAGYDKLITREDFPPETYRDSKWGVHDHWVLERLLEECNSSATPFFKAFMALSSHEPFRVPMPVAIEGNDEETLFLNAAYYSDRAVGDFIRSAKETDWWEHSLVVITADHGSRHPGNIPNYHPEHFHVPMLWLGGAIAKADTVIDAVASQTDIPLTILHQLGLQSDGYRFSRDILGTTADPFGFYDFNDGFGFVTGDTRIAFDNVSRTVIYQEGPRPEDAAEKGKAYLQVFSEDFKMRDQVDKHQ